MPGHYRVLNDKDKEFISPWNYSVGVNLMDYCYIGNKFMNIVLNEIYEGTWKNKPVAWVCDQDLIGKYANCWGESIEVQVLLYNAESLNYSEVCIINNDKKEFIDLVEYKKEWKIARENITHPFPILTNASSEYQGEGDYDFEHINRGRWEGDRFVITFDRNDVPYGFTNITKDSIFYTTEQLREVNNEFRMKSKFLSTHEDSEVRDRMIDNIEDKAFRRDSFFDREIDYSPYPPPYK